MTKRNRGPWWVQVIAALAVVGVALFVGMCAVSSGAEDGVSGSPACKSYERLVSDWVRGETISDDQLRSRATALKFDARESGDDRLVAAADDFDRAVASGQAVGAFAALSDFADVCGKDLPDFAKS